jgi:hypothetical protein
MRVIPACVSLAVAGASLVFILAASPAFAQDTSGTQQPPPGGTAGQESALDKPVNINLRDIPLRSALELLFQGTGLNYAVDPNVGNPLLTINLKDQPFRLALRTLVHLAASQVPGLTYTDENGLYLIKIRQAPPPEAEQPATNPDDSQTAEEPVWEKIPINYTSAQLLTLIFGGMNIPDESMLAGSMMGGGMGGGFGGGGFGGGGLGGLGGGFGGGGFGGGGLGGFGGGLGGGGFGGGGFGGGGLGGGGLGGFGGGGLGGFGGGGLGGGVGGGFGGGFGGGGRRF